MVKWNGLLPLGSIVLLEGSDKRMQIVGQIQADPKTLQFYDYAAVPYPEGFIDEDNLAKFRHEDIRIICSVGHLDENTWNTLKRLEKLRDDLREGRTSVKAILERRANSTAQTGERSGR